MLKVVIALILLAHGIGHSLGLLQIFNHPESWWTGRRS